MGAPGAVLGALQAVSLNLNIIQKKSVALFPSDRWGDGAQCLGQTSQWRGRGFPPSIGSRERVPATKLYCFGLSKTKSILRFPQTSCLWLACSGSRIGAAVTPLGCALRPPSSHRSQVGLLSDLCSPVNRYLLSRGPRTAAPVPFSLRSHRAPQEGGKKLWGHSRDMSSSPALRGWRGENSQLVWVLGGAGWT